MASQRTIEAMVGMFLLAAITALIVLAFKVSGLTSFFKTDGYVITANFQDIGQLKVRSAVKIGGVLVGEVTKISLDPETFDAIVTMRINENKKNIPADSSAAILTAGLLGDNYIEITPMYSSEVLKQGSVIEETHSAMILEKLIGQFLFKSTNSNDSTSKKSDSNSPKEATP